MNTRIEAVIIIVKAFCFVLIGGLTPLATALTQWLNTGEWPPRINWVAIIAGCIVGAATQLLSFLSQSFGDWKAQRAVDAGGTAPQFTKQPQADEKKEIK